jgi:DNA-binding response OmpR family regulator
MIKILILDDEKGLLGQLKKYFGYRGYTVFAVTNGKEALSILKKENPQILVLDIRMEGISGLDVLKKAKASNANVKAIMLTAMDDDVTKLKAKELGADEYITKPFSYTVLESIIIRMVNEVLRQEETQKK